MEFTLLLLVGFVVGIFSGMFGIGGAVIMTPILILMGYPENIALATPLVSAVASSVSGSLVYYKEKLINYRTGIIILLAALSTAWIGVMFSNIPTSTLIYIKTGFMFLLAMRMLFPDKHTTAKKASILLLLVIGAFAGFFSALIAIGGGLIFVFTFSSLLKMEIKQTIATSLFCVGVLALVNSVLHYYKGNVDLTIALPILIGVFLGAQIGSRIAIKLSSVWLKRVFAIVLSLFAIFFILFRMFFTTY